MRKATLLTLTFLSTFFFSHPLFASDAATTATQAATNANPTVQVITNLGEFVIELNQKKAPISVKNFLSYVDSGFYNGTQFHRVIKNFMVQGGGFDQNMKKKPTDAPIKNEAENGLKNVRGSIAMARTNVVDSATAQFFINTVDNPFLDNGSRGFGYAVFGKVIKGMDVVDQIEKTRTTMKNGMRDVPSKPIVVEKMTRL